MVSCQQFFIFNTRIFSQHESQHGTIRVHLSIMTRLRIGLTGGIAAGKSTVARRMQEDGAYIIDYDQLAHLLQEPQSPAILVLVNRFGEDILREDGGINRAVLGALVFNSSQRDRNIADLNAIMHPLVYELAMQREHAIVTEHEHAIIVHDIPLLAQVIHTDTLPLDFDHIVTVYASEATRVERLVNDRGLVHDDAIIRVQEQGSDESRLAISDIVINAEVPIEQMFETVDSLIHTWQTQMEQ